jgi:hypothetical protein
MYSVHTVGVDEDNLFTIGIVLREIERMLLY